MKHRISEFQGLPLAKRFQGVRKFCPGRQACVLYKDGDNRNTALQRRPDFERDKIAGLLEPLAEPVLSDENHRGVASVNLGLDRIRKILTGLYRAHVHEHALLTK